VSEFAPVLPFSQQCTVKGSESDSYEFYYALSSEELESERVSTSYQTCTRLLDASSSPDGSRHWNCCCKRRPLMGASDTYMFQCLFG
jgi:hypothetical protein